MDYYRRKYPGPGYVLKGDVRSIWKYDPAAAVAEGDVEAKSEPDPFVTEFWDYLGAKFNLSRDTSFFGPLIGGATLPASAVHSLNDQQVKELAEKLRKLGKVDLLGKNSNLRQNVAEYLNAALPDQKQAAYDLIAQALRDAGIKFLTEDEWKKSGWQHPALRFEPFMTPERAEAKFLNLKKLAAYAYLIRQRPDGLFSGTAGFFAGLAGDPMNYIPSALALKEIYAGARIPLSKLFRRVPGAGGVDAAETGVGPTVNSAAGPASGTKGIGAGNRPSTAVDAKSATPNSANVTPSVSSEPNTAIKPLFKNEKDAVTKIDNIINNNIKPHDIEGAIKDLQSQPIWSQSKGRFYQHIEDLDKSIKALRKTAGRLSNTKDPVGIEARKRALQRAEELERILEPYRKGAKP